MTLIKLLQTGALLHLALLCAGATMPKAVHLREHLAVLPGFIRNLFWTYYVFLGFVLASFGLLTWTFAGEMAAGVPLGRALALVCCLFWVGRCLVAVFVFDVRPYLTSWYHKVGYQMLNVVFVYLMVVYAITIWAGGRL